MNPVFKAIAPHLAAILIFLVSATLYFSPQLQGRFVRQGDVQQYLGMSQEVRQYYEETGERSLWTNAMFGGMPTYQINSISAGNSLIYLDKAGRLTIKQPIGRFLIAMVWFYILLIVLRVNPWLAMIGAFAYSLTTNNLVLYEAGHMTKLRVLSHLPLLAAGLILLFHRRQYIWGGLLFTAGFGLCLWANHPQMVYYFFMTLVIFGVAELVYSQRKGEMTHFLKAGAIAIAGILIGVLTAASNLWVTYEYSKDTMRGKPILAQTTANPNPQSSSETEGLAWDYAMAWSNSVIDVFASFIPGVAGGGSSEKVGSDMPMAKDPGWQQYLAQSGNTGPLYWGDLTFTSGPIYFGAVIFFLFFMGLSLVKGPLKWWVGLGTLLTFMISMGSNLEWFNRLLFDYLPLFNKFRTPNSVLSVTALLVTLLGFLALGKVIRGETDKKEIQRSLLIAGGVGGGISLFFWLIGPGVYDFSHPGDARFEQYGFNLNVLVETRKALMRQDALRTFALVALSAGLIWAFLREKINKNLLIAGIALLVIFDMWTVGRRYLDKEDFSAQASNVHILQPRPADTQILQDKDPNFRVLDVSVNPFTSSYASYFHKSLGGYHAAKLQRYQDIIDRYLSQNNQAVINMLNTKYIILPPQQQGQGPAVQQNPGAMGNAWFVGNIRMVSTPNEEIDALGAINPRREAVVHQEFADYVAGLSVDSIAGGQIQMTAYAPNHLTYSSNSDQEHLAVFSEIWYGPEKGWQAYIDGEPVEHIRVNYLLRGLRIPAGQHTIEFKFDPQSYRAGVLISRIFSTLVLFGVVGYAGFKGYHYVQNLPAEAPKPAPQPRPVSGKAASTRRPPTGRKKGDKKKGKK